MSNKFGSKAFKRFLVSYLIVLMIPVIIGVYAYNKTVEVIEDDAKNSNLAVLSQSKETLDIRLREVEQLATELALNPKILHLLNVDPPFSDQEYYQIYEVLMDVKKYNLNQFITDYYLHFPKSQLLITRRSMYEMPKSYETFFSYGDLNYNEWLEKFKYEGRLNRYFSAENVKYNGMNQDMITFQKVIFPGYTKEEKGSVFVMFSEEEIEKMFDHLVLDNGGWAYILDEQGDVIYGTTPQNKVGDHSLEYNNMDGSGYFDDEVGEERMFVSYTTSSYNGWTYVAALPSNTVLARANYIKKITWIVTLVSIVIGILFALLMARRNSKPIREIMDTFKDFVSGEQVAKGSEYDFIKGTVKQLVHNHNHLKKSYDQQIPFLQASFFNRLFKGEFKDLKELAAVSSQSRLALAGNTYIVFVLRFSEYDGLISQEILEEINRNKLLVKSALTSITDNHVLIYDGDDNILTVLLDLQEQTDVSLFRQQLEKRTRQLLDILQIEAGISVKIGIGGAYGHPLDIWKSYNEAHRALEYGARINQAVYWHEDLPIESNLYYFPMDLEVRLINTAKSGNREALLQLFKHIEEVNFHTRKLTDTVIRQLLYEIKGTMLKILEPMQQMKASFDEWFIHFDEKNSVMEDYEKMKHSFLELCSAVEREKQDQNVHLINRMTDYIESNYSKYHISLSSMASHFHLSESYASTFFKENIGENFSVYLESVRMKEAQNLLSHTESSINDIAIQIGYSSDKAFRRAFKRYTGILPTIYRNMDPLAKVDFVQNKENAHEA